jgi:hypothetical protein
MRTKKAMLQNLLLVAAVMLASLMTAGVTRAADQKKPATAGKPRPPE